MKTTKSLILLIAMLVPMTSVALSGCNGNNKVSKATPDQATALITTQQVTTQAQTEPTVAETTQAPKTDYKEAYKAYKTILQQNAFEIKAYDYQNKTDESKQIVFADIMGDFTPELIFVKSVEDTYNDYTYVTLNIYTYSDGECKKISFKNKDEYQLQTSLQHTYDPYILFKSSDGKDLYLFTQRRMTSNVCRFFKFTTDNCEENEIDFKMIMEQTKLRFLISAIRASYLIKKSATVNAINTNTAYLIIWVLCCCTAIIWTLNMITITALKSAKLCHTRKQCHF